MITSKPIDTKRVDLFRHNGTIRAGRLWRVSSGNGWAFSPDNHCNYRQGELQQIVDKLRELNGGATDGQEPCES